MKKLLILGIAVFFAFSMNAQRFGVRVGGNFSDMKSSIESKGTKIAPGLQAGLLAEIGSKRLGVRIEANFAQKGFNQDYTEDILGVATEIKSNVDFGYIEIPALLKVKIVGPLYVYAGPYFGFAFSGKSTNEMIADGVEVDLGAADEVDILKVSDTNPIPYKKTDFGAAGGLGVQFGLGPIHLFAEGRATLGLSNLYDTESDAWDAYIADGGYKDKETLKNMVYTVAIGIVFGK